MNVLSHDKRRYGDGRLPAFHFFMRKAQACSVFPLKQFYKILFVFFRKINHNDISLKTQIGPGLYFGHPYCIVINPGVIIGTNVNIHKGVTIGQENRGKRKGTPIIGNDVWIGINTTITGKVSIGNDVLIAPNSFVNLDIPDHSVVIGNPAKIFPKEKATEGYINHRIHVENNENKK